MKTKRISTINKRIEAEKDKIAGLQGRLNKEFLVLESLIKEKEEAQLQAIGTALKSSGKTYEEVLIFLGAQR